MSPTPSSVRRLTAAVLMLVLTTTPMLTACSSRRQVALTGVRPESVAIQGKARVTLLNGTSTYLEHATLTSDSISGNQRITGRTDYQRTSIALGSVTSIESERFNAAKTLLIVAATVAALGVVTYAAVGSSIGPVLVY